MLAQAKSQLVALPPTMMTLARLQRDLEVKQEVFKLLAAEEVNARITEAKEVPRLQVLDEAVVPERKEQPSAAHNALLVGALGSFLGVIGAFIRGSWKTERGTGVPGSRGRSESA